MMTFEQDFHYPHHHHNGQRSIKGRSSSLSATGYPVNSLEGTVSMNSTRSTGGGGVSAGAPVSGPGRRPVQGGILINPSSSSRENGQSARYRTSSISDYPQPANSLQQTSAKSSTVLPPKQQSPPNSATTNRNSTATGTAAAQNRKHGAHRSQSARVVGSKPKVKRREALRDYQQHLDLASSEGALRDCQDSYNPFLRKVPSSGRLITANSSGEMSNSSLYTSNGTVAPPVQAQEQSSPHSTPPRDSPKILRRQSTAFEVRRGSDKSTPDKDPLSTSKKAAGLGAIPAISTPECSPTPQRRASAKPAGLPKSPQVTRSSSTRRANSVKGRRNTTFLDVPDLNMVPPEDEDEDEESYRLRSFNVTSKGIVNRGDSFRRRRSRSNSLVPTPATTPELQRNPTFISSQDGLLLPGPPNDSFSRRSPLPSPRSPQRPFPAQPLIPTSFLAQLGHGQGGDEEEEEHEGLVNHRVAMIGSRGVGKAALVSQFMTSECINAYDRQNDVEGEETVSVNLNGEESELTFFKVQNPKTDLNRLDPPEAFVIVYSVVDRSSFQKAEAELRKLQEWDLSRMKAVVLVGNKIDLVRSRAVSTQDGRCLAVSFRVKFIEVSVGINHNVDELLVGLLHQIRLKQSQTGNQDSWCKHRGILRASVKARQMLTWLLGKEDAKFKNCENLHIL